MSLGVGGGVGALTTHTIHSKTNLSSRTFAHMTSWMFVLSTSEERNATMIKFFSSLFFFACSLPHSIVRILFREISLWNYGIRWKLCDLCLCNKVKENFIIVFAAKNVAFVCVCSNGGSELKWLGEFEFYSFFSFRYWSTEHTHSRKKHGKSTYDFALIHRNLVIRKKLLFSSFRLVSCQSYLFPPPLCSPFMLL